MSPIRQRMIDDMRLRNFSPHTRDAYVRAVAQFTKHFMKPPDTLTPEHVREYLLHLVQVQRVAWSRLRACRKGVASVRPHQAGRCPNGGRLRAPSPPSRGCRVMPSWSSQLDLQDVVRIDLDKAVLLRHPPPGPLRVGPETLGGQVVDDVFGRVVDPVRRAKRRPQCVHVEPQAVVSPKSASDFDS